MYKRLITAMLTIVLSTFMSMSAFAQNTQVGYAVTGNYEVIIPSYVDLNSENHINIETGFMSLMDGYKVKVSVDKSCLTNNTLVLTSENGDMINTELMVISEGSGTTLQGDYLVASYTNKGKEYGGTLQIMPLVYNTTNAGQYYGTLIFETELVQE